MKVLSVLMSLILMAGALSAADHDSTLEAALAGDHRSEANRARDIYRHPAETLEFFGFRPDMTVVEFWPGGGWYTEVLAPALRANGRLVLATYGESEDPEAYRSRNHRAFVEKLEARPDLYGATERIVFWPPATNTLGPSGSADLVVTFRNMHSMQRRDQHGAFFAAAFDVLKPGGTLGIVQHRAPDGIDAKTTARSGYVPTTWVFEQARAAGFELTDSSEINANPKDTKDYAEGVWTLPPALRAKDGREDEYRAIGESDRMTLKFIKPPKGQPIPIQEIARPGG